MRRLHPSPWPESAAPSPYPIPGGIVARTGYGAQPPAPPPHAAIRTHDYAFLVPGAIDWVTLRLAEIEAKQTGVATHEALLASGWLRPASYAVALARELGTIGVARRSELEFLGSPARTVQGGVVLAAHWQGRACHVLDASDGGPDAVRRRCEALHRQGMRVALAPRAVVEDEIERQLRDERMEGAVEGLLRNSPDSSAGARIRTWQIVAAAIVTGLVIGGFIVLPEATLAAATGLIALPFLCVTLLRLVALKEALGRSVKRVGGRLDAGRLPDHLLPTYTVMVRHCKTWADGTRST